MGWTAAIMLASAGYSAYAQDKAGKQQQKLANMNADIRDKQAADAIERGDEDARAIKRKANLIKGAQRAAFASQGVDVGTGAPVDFELDTDTLAAADILTVKNNARREAWGYKTDASFSRFEGKLRRRQARMDAGATILGGTAGGYQAYRADYPRT